VSGIKISKQNLLSTVRSTGERVRVSGIKIRKQNPLSTVRSTGERVRVRGIKIGSRSDSLIIFGGYRFILKTKRNH
jgi:hypothetical protein